MNRDSLLFQKTAGCLLGGAAGDAFGGPLECMHFRAIRELYGGRVEEMLPYRRPEDFFQPGHLAYSLNGEAGSFTDDTRLQLLISRAIAEKGGRIDADDLADFWMRNMDVSGFWFSVSGGFHRIAMSDTPVRQAGAGNISENSAPMCIGPVGAINAGNPAQAALDAYDLISLSHEGVAREAAACLAAAVAEAMRPETTVESVVEAAIRFAPNRETSPMPRLIERASLLAREARDAEALTEMYYSQLNVKWFKRSRQAYLRPRDDERFSPSCDVKESVPVVLGMFLHCRGDFRQTIVSTANYGRDCDTTACMAGYLAGAYQGLDAIPADWVEKVIKANPETDLLQISEGVARALVGERRRMLRQCRMIEKMEGLKT